MSSTELDYIDDEIIWELEGDIGSLASISALELDNLLNNKPYDLEAVNRLVKKIRELMTPSNKSEHKEFPLISLIDPFTMVVMNKVMIDLDYYQPKQTVKKVIDETKQIAKRLQKVYDNNFSKKINNEENNKEIEKMRKFCLTLSRKARAYEPSPYDHQPPYSFMR